MFDTHCHLQFNAYKNDADEVYKKCADKGMFLNIVGSQRDTSERAVEYAEKYPNAFATVGLHPIHLTATEVDEEEIRFKSREEKFDYEFYKNFASRSKVIAMGECGLDLFHLPEKMSRAEAVEIQKEAFLAQHKLAQELDLPLVIHVRDAYEEMIDLLSVIARSLPAGKAGEATKQSHRYGNGIASLPAVARNDIKGVVHCYTSDWKNAEQYLAFGLYLGFTGVITFPPKKTDPKAQNDLLEVVKNCPLDRILIETDAPYLAPQTYRGQRCEPWMVEEVAKKIAEIKGLALDEVITATDKNAKKLFTKAGV